VLFSGDTGESPGVVMHPGETRRLALNDRKITPPDTVIQSSAVAWKEGNMAYRDERLGVILEDVERRFAIDIDLRATHLLQKEFTFEYRQPKTAKEVVDILSEGLGLRYSQTARGIAVYPSEP